MSAAEFEEAVRFIISERLEQDGEHISAEFMMTPAGDWSWDVIERVLVERGLNTASVDHPDEQSVFLQNPFGQASVRGYVVTGHNHHFTIARVDQDKGSRYFYINSTDLPPRLATRDQLLSYYMCRDYTIHVVRDPPSSVFVPFDCFLAVPDEFSLALPSSARGAALAAAHRHQPPGAGGSRMSVLGIRVRLLVRYLTDVFSARAQVLLPRRSGTSTACSNRHKVPTRQAMSRQLAPC